MSFQLSAGGSNHVDDQNKTLYIWKLTSRKQRASTHLSRETKNGQEPKIQKTASKQARGRRIGALKIKSIDQGAAVWNQAAGAWCHTGILPWQPVEPGSKYRRFLPKPGCWAIPSKAKHPDGSWLLAGWLAAAGWLVDPIGTIQLPFPDTHPHPAPQPLPTPLPLGLYLPPAHPPMIRYLLTINQLINSMDGKKMQRNNRQYS